MLCYASGACRNSNDLNFCYVPTERFHLKFLWDLCQENRGTLQTKHCHYVHHIFLIWDTCRCKTINAELFASWKLFFHHIKVMNMTQFLFKYLKLKFSLSHVFLSSPCILIVPFIFPWLGLIKSFKHQVSFPEKGSHL